jgi:hypothetical protein
MNFSTESVLIFKKINTILLFYLFLMHKSDYIIALILLLFPITNCRLIYAFAIVRHGALYPKKGYYSTNFKS